MDLIYKQTAIDTVRKLYILEPRVNNDYAYDMAIDQADDALRELPSADAVEVVRCKDCIHAEHWYGDKSRCFLWHEDGIDVFDDGFCNYAERKQDE